MLSELYKRKNKKTILNYSKERQKKDKKKNY